MEIGARNVFNGRITELVDGVVNTDAGINP